MYPEPPVPKIFKTVSLSFFQRSKDLLRSLLDGKSMFK